MHTHTLFFYIMATTNTQFQHADGVPITINQLFRGQRKVSKSTRNKHNRRAREARREIAWETNSEVADIRLLGERFEGEETEFVSRWNPEDDYGFTPLPESWLANRLRAKRAIEREEQEAADEVARVRRATDKYKHGVDACFRTVRNWFLRHKISREENDFAAAVLEEMDNADGEPGDELVEEERMIRGTPVKRLKPRHRNDMWWVKYAVVTRSEHPLLTDSPAQRRTVHRYALDLMKADNVTRTDAARVIYKVVEAAYVPSSVEVEVAKFRESRPVRQRLWDATAPYWTYWWGVRRRAASAD